MISPQMINFDESSIIYTKSIDKLKKNHNVTHFVPKYAKK